MAEVSGPYGLPVPVPEGPLPEGEEWVAVVVPLNVALGMPLPVMPVVKSKEIRWKT